MFTKEQQYVINSIVNAIENNQRIVAHFGNRRCGKTAMMKEIQKRLTEKK
jgi:predicted AAA+ superfamily ATPase